MIGLGRMGATMVRRLTRAGQTCVGHARRAEMVDALVKEGMLGSTSMADLVDKLARRRAVWLMGGRHDRLPARSTPVV